MPRLEDIIDYDKQGGVDYNKTLERWRKKYKVIMPMKAFNPVRIKLACSKCKRIRALKRHHKGCDFMFACIMPDAFAPRYLEFHDDDCDMLCDDCHHYFHQWIRPFRNVVLYEVDIRKMIGVRVTDTFLKNRRAELRKLYNVWLYKKDGYRGVSEPVK